MNKAALLFSVSAVAALLSLGSGCATTSKTEELLSSAGFKTVVAATPEQRAHLKSLPPHKVTQAAKNGKTYYVFPDAAHDLLYVGQQANYQRYHELCLQRALAEEQASPVREMETNWSVWGEW